jgi:outer membrane receptor protein involved in Fe transport
MNYTDSYRNNLVTPAEKISSWTTFDGQIAWRVKDGGLSVSLDVLNLTDARPPRVSGGNNINLGFDPTNASPRGRFIALQIGKRWW